VGVSCIWPCCIEREGIVHSSLYLKNLLKRDLSLEHIVKVDPYGAWSEVSLRKMSREEVLEKFYGYYANDFVSSVQSSLNEGVRGMNNAVKNAAAGVLGDPIPEDAIELNEETYEASFTKKGGFLLLEKLGFFKQLDTLANG
jgi:hypothetical protein